jgi:hypothetical protein
MTLGFSKRNRDHVGGHEVRHAHAEVEPVGDDVDESAFGHDVDMHVRVTRATNTIPASVSETLRVVRLKGRTPR